MRYEVAADGAVDQPARAGAPAAAAPTVVVRDDRRRPVRGVRVAFTVRRGGGALEALEATTDASGRASAGRWLLGEEPGLQVVDAIVDSGTAVSFRATALPRARPLASAGACPVSDSLRPDGWALPRTVARLRAREALVVVAIGSSSTEGVGASSADSTYPARTRALMQQLFPASTVHVHNAGLGGQTLEMIVQRMQRDVYARSPDLVLLQTGTVDVIAGVPIDAYATRLTALLADLRARGIDVVLQDSQRYPGMGESVQYREYVTRTGEIARAAGVPVVRRYAWMSEWIAAGTYTYSQILYADRFHTNDLTYGCVARYTADGITSAVVAGL